MELKTNKQKWDAIKLAQQSLYLQMRDFKRRVKDGKTTQQLGVIIEEDGKKHVYIPYSKYTKITLNKKRW